MFRLFWRKLTMTIGFPAYHEESFSITTQEFGSFRDAIRETIAVLSWTIEYETSDEIMAKTPINLLSFGETVSITFPTAFSIAARSQCAIVTQVFDWGKNKSNVQKFKTELLRRI